MNLILIGNNLHDYSKKIWEADTNFTILECTDIKNTYFLQYIKNKKVIIESTTKQFEEKYQVIDIFLEFCENTKTIPVFISDCKDSFEEKMYKNVETFIKSAVLYRAGEDELKKDLNELIKIGQEYLLNKGIDDDRIVRTPKKRKRPSSKA